MVYLLFSESKQVVENAYVPFYWNALVAFIDLPLFVYMFVTFPKYNCLLAGVRIKVLLILSVGLISIVTGASIMKKGPFDNYLNNEYVVVGRYGLLTKQAMDYLYLDDNEQELTYGKELLFSKNKKSLIINILEIFSICFKISLKCYNIKINNVKL